MAALRDEKQCGWSFRKFALAALVAFVFFRCGKSRQARTLSSVVSNCTHEAESFQFRVGVSASRERAYASVNQRSSCGHVANSSGPQFVFFAGLEGTGHHIMQAIYRSSPAKRVIDALNLTEPLEKLEKLLFHPVGFMFQHCDTQWKDEFDYQCRAPHEESKEGCVLRNAHDLFASIRAALVENGYNQVFVPLNIMRHRASYPDGVGPCRAFKYPSLDRLYRICDHSGVPCRHVYLIRDPFLIERSTVQKRPFNPSEMEALQIHTTMLNILFAQMHSHAEKLLGCVELTPTEPRSNATKPFDFRRTATVSSTTHTPTIKRIGDANLRDQMNPHSVSGPTILSSSLQLVSWLGWQQISTTTSSEREEFKNFLQRSIIQKPSLPLREDDVVPPELRFQLSSLLRSHDAVIQLCAIDSRRRRASEKTEELRKGSRS
jgi:hypothetical protein